MIPELFTGSSINKLNLKFHIEISIVKIVE